MSKKQKRRFKPSTKLTRISIVVWALLVIGLLGYSQVVRPNDDAEAFTARLDNSSEPLEKCFEKLAKTTELQIYYAPDIPMETRKADATAIRTQVEQCRRQLAEFNTTAHTLKDFRFAGYTGEYKDAKVNQRQALDVIGQSTDVMNQYDRLASFLLSYYGNIETYLSYTQSLSNLDTSIVTNANRQALESQANDLRTRAKAIAELDAPAEFQDTKQQTSKLFTDTATGLDTVARGYANYADFITTQGFNQVDAASKFYDGTVVNLPFEQLTKSYIPKQVQQLPGKIAGLLAGQSE